MASRRYRLYPTTEQQKKMRRFSGARTFVFNLGREQRELASKTTGRSPGLSRQAADLKELRDDPGIAPWLKGIPTQILQQALKDVASAYDRLCRGLASYPRYKHRSDRRQSFRVPQHVEVRRLSRKWSEVKLQGLGWVRYRSTRPLGGKVKNAAASLEAGRFHVSIQVEVPDRRDPPNAAPAVGIDRGVAHALATSDGRFHDMPGHHSKEDERLMRLERKRERQRRGSANQRKTKSRIAAICARRARRRHDFCHKQTSKLAKGCGAVAIEALSVRDMTRSARGTKDKPGKNVAQKAGLNTQAEFSCIRCGHTEHADINAAKVILGRGIAILRDTAPAAGSAVAPPGDSGLPGSVKQEPERPARDRPPALVSA